jgi:hypothetical protein
MYIDDDIHLNHENNTITLNDFPSHIVHLGNQVEHDRWCRLIQDESDWSGFTHMEKSLLMLISYLIEKKINGNNIIEPSQTYNLYLKGMNVPQRHKFYQSFPNLNIKYNKIRFFNQCFIQIQISHDFFNVPSYNYMFETIRDTNRYRFIQENHLREYYQEEEIVGRLYGSFDTRISTLMNKSPLAYGRFYKMISYWSNEYNRNVRRLIDVQPQICTTAASTRYNNKHVQRTLSDSIFDIKDKMTDLEFKFIMDTLAKIQ